MTYLFSGTSRFVSRIAVLETVKTSRRSADIESKNQKSVTGMRAPLEALGYEITGELPVYGIFDRGKVKQEDNVVSQAQRLGADLAGSLRQ